MVSNLNPKLLFEQPGRRRAICRPISSERIGALALRLGHLPDERGAVRTAATSPACPAGPASTMTGRHHHRARRSPTWTAPIMDARAFGWSRAPIVEMLIPSTLDDSLAPPGRHVASLFCQQVAPTLPDGRSLGRPPRRRSPT